jgi:hypothetical protein
LKELLAPLCAISQKYQIPFSFFKKEYDTFRATACKIAKKSAKLEANCRRQSAQIAISSLQNCR